ncbi:hypothetical protein Nocox_31060 [Nonomuraea coxensis DSM 45129]|uniref:Uncharacterized protein n=1 Tax=Nonomuraea coxensis DSM 45129 TaxID=1122611 RepID=A0ABX8U7W8_9ACTN|nr:hypothetical protein [Nonomuraea coxensis]QYC43793.1 hypothetical protein Nocox_31060 [Nonomuraea coxensis DSM 45129]
MINDEYVLAALRLAAGADPPPAHVSAAAREVYGLRVAGSLTAAPAAEAATVRAGAGTRGDDGSHLVRFVADGLTFDLEVTVGDGLIDVAGQVFPCPGEGAFVDVRTPHLTLSRPISPNGCFAATGLPPGWLSVVCHRPGQAPVQTRWVRIRP